MHGLKLLLQTNLNHAGTLILPHHPVHFSLFCVLLYSFIITFVETMKSSSRVLVSIQRQESRVRNRADILTTAKRLFSADSILDVASAK